MLLELSDLLNVIVGGLLAIAGGIVGAAVQARYARKRRMEEITAERKVTVNGDAYARAKRIETVLIHEGIEASLALMQSHEEWFWSNRLFMPGKFAQIWLDIRNAGSRLVSTEDHQRINDDIRRQITKAIEEIYKETGHKKLQDQG